MTSQPTGISKKRAILNILIPAVVILSVIWGALFIVQKRMGRTEKGPTTQVGSTLPDLTLIRADGTKTQLFHQKPKITLINFWATWCEACLEEMPSLVELHKTRRDQGLRVIAINLDEDSSKAISSTVKDFGIEFENFVDSDGNLSAIFDVHAIPLTITIDSHGKILEIFSGDRNWMAEKYLQKLDQWLKESPTP